jgi:exopolysaccharide biosynthesis protein
LHLTRGYQSESESTGPWVINLLRIDPRQVRVRVAHALDEAVGLETTSSMAARYGAVAAVNAGFFRTAGTFRGDAAGLLSVDGQLLSEPINNRTAVCFVERGDRTETTFRRFRFSGVVEAGHKATHTVHGLNRQREKDELIVLTPEFHKTTLTTPDGIELVVRRGRVVEVRDGQGSTMIPTRGFVISAHGAARDWASKHLVRGSRARLSLALIDAETGLPYVQGPGYIVGGGPQLVRAGRVDILQEAEGISARFVNDRHPRTAIAKLDGGHLLIVTVDGRQPGVSVGMSLIELAQLLVEYGAQEAMNLDGGGSTTMVINGKLVNKPSDAGGERPVSDAILVLPRGRQKGGSR